MPRVARSLLDPPRYGPPPLAERPSMGKILSMACAVSTAFDDGARSLGVQWLQRRTMVGYSGPAGGFALPWDMSKDVFDRARTTDGPWRRCRWVEQPTRMWTIPAVAETSRANGSRWGGIQASWGYGETSVPPGSQSSLSSVEFTAQRLLIYVPSISRDLWADSTGLDLWFSYVALAEFRYQIESAMINGASAAVGGVACPVGVIDAPSTVTVAKDGGQSSGTISTTNIDNMWAAIAAGNKENAVWHANDDTIKAIDEVATAYNWPQSVYLPQGINGNPHALIKGRPLLPSECCPAIGTPGDLIAVDWTDYVLTYLKPKGYESALAFEFRIPDDLHHRGVVGLPEGIVEQRMSDQAFFSTDSLAFLWKFRGDGHFLWNSTMTNINGAVVGPAAIIAKR